MRPKFQHRARPPGRVAREVELRLVGRAQFEAPIARAALSQPLVFVLAREAAVNFAQPLEARTPAIVARQPDSPTRMLSVLLCPWPISLSESASLSQIYFCPGPERSAAASLLWRVRRARADFPAEAVCHSERNREWKLAREFPVAHGLV